MSADDDLEQWLKQQPLDEPVDVDGETVYLNVAPNGAELGAYLADSYTPLQLQDALIQGFQSAMHFDAGLGISPDGVSLVLTRWLPDVTSWTEAAEALEELLNQVAMWKSSLSPSRPSSGASASRHEQRLRMFFAGAKNENE